MDAGSVIEAGRPLRIRVRRASEEDTDAVLAFSRTTFDGWDYLPGVWASWLEARDGAVFVAEPVEPGEAAGDRNGRPIAVGRVALLSPAEAWMEGLRVDPAVRGRGVATAFQVAELTWAQAQGAAVVRYATGETNEASLRLGARHGFAPAGRWRALRPQEPEGSAAHATAPQAAPSAEEATPATRRTILSNLAAAGLVRGAGEAGRRWDRLAGDATFRRGRGLYEWRAWAWQALSREGLERHLERGDLLEVETAEGWALGLLGHERVAGETRLVLLGGDAESARRLVDAVAQAAGRRPLIRLPDESLLLDGLGPALESAGWRIAEHVLVLMARPLADEAGRPLSLPDDGTDRVEFAEAPRPLGLVPEDEPEPLPAAGR